MCCCNHIDSAIEIKNELLLLKNDIAKKRLELFKVINESNEYLTDKKVVQLSQQLDGLLVRYIKISTNKAL